MLSLIFVHSALDDAGLSANQFRIYAHLARRGGNEGQARPGVESIAEHCKLHPDTVRTCLKELHARCMVEFEERSGCARRYILTSPEKWTNPPETNGGVPPRKKGRPFVSTPPKQIPHTPPFVSDQTPPKQMETKVIPEGNPLKAQNASVPASGNLTKAEVWTRSCALLHRPANKARSYQEERALADAADLTGAEMRQIERLHAFAAEHPERQIRLRQKVEMLLSDLPGELAKAAQHLNGHANGTAHPAGRPRAPDPDTTPLAVDPTLFRAFLSAHPDFQSFNRLPATEAAMPKSMEGPWKDFKATHRK